MKSLEKILTITVRVCLMPYALCLVFGARAENPFFHDTENQIALHVGHSVGPGPIRNMIPNGDWRSEPFEQVMFTYSQPFEFFRLPGRQNMHIGGNIGYSGMTNYTNPVGGISWDTALLWSHDFYFGAGAGMYIKLNHDDRMDSLLMFGSKIFIGWRFTEIWSAEIYVQHFDNGGTTMVDGGYNFIGLGALWNF